MRILNQALVLGALVAVLTGTAAQAAEKPNVVLMVIDNLGWGEIGTYGGGSFAVRRHQGLTRSPTKA